MAAGQLAVVLDLAEGGASGARSIVPAPRPRRLAGARRRGRARRQDDRPERDRSGGTGGARGREGSLRNAYKAPMFEALVKRAVLGGGLPRRHERPWTGDDSLSGRSTVRSSSQLRHFDRGAVELGREGAHDRLFAVGQDLLRLALVLARHAMRPARSGVGRKTVDRVNACRILNAVVADRDLQGSVDDLARKRAFAGEADEDDAGTGAAEIVAQMVDARARPCTCRNPR